MTTDAGLSHAQAHAFLHTGRRHLSGSEAKQLDAHLAACADCRAYAAYLTTAEPALAAALHTRWDRTQPALPEREFVARVRARAGHRRPAERPAWLAAAPLAAAALVLVLAAVWLGGGGLNGLVGPGSGAQPTEVAQPTATRALDLPAALLERWVAFLTREADNRDALYVMHLDGNDGRYLLDEAGERYYGGGLTWSPDGTQLAFVSDRTGRPEVFVAQAGSWTVKQLTLNTEVSDAVDYSLAWLANSSSILVTQRPVGTNMYQSGKIYLLDTNVTLVRFPEDAQRIQGEVTGDPVWSPDGRWLVYSGLNAQGQPAIFECEPACPGRQLTPATDPASGAHDIYLGLAWSPDSRHVAYLRQGPWVGGLNDAQPGEGFHASIEMLTSQAPALEAGSPLTLSIASQTTLLDVASPNGIMGLSWSPDGAYLLYLADDSLSGCWSPYLLPAAGGEPLRLVGVCYLTRTAPPQWSADSRYLLLSTEAGLAVVDVPAALADPAHVVPMFLQLPADLPGLAHSPAWQRWP